MSEISCYDFEGKPLKMLYQWDRNQTITMRGVPKAASTAFHFANCRSKEAIVVSSEVKNDAHELVIPNSLLRDNVPVVIYIYQYENDGGTRTKDTVVIPVIPRPRPSEYEYQKVNGIAFTWGNLKFGFQSDPDFWADMK